MKKTLLSILFGLFTCTFAVGQSLTSTGEAMSSRVFKWIKESQGDSLLLHATPEVKEQITAPVINSIFKQLELQMGKFKSNSSWSNSAIDGYSIYHTDLFFEKQNIGLNITLNDKCQVAGFFLVPATTSNK